MLGQITVPTTTSDWWSFFAGDTARQLMSLLGIIGIVGLFVVLWVVFIRRPSRRERRKYPKYPKYPEGAQEEAVADEDKADAEHHDGDDSPEGRGQRRHHGRRRRMETHRPRNPTLAETGGLPPLREDGQPPKQ